VPRFQLKDLPMPDLPIACTLTQDGMTARLALLASLAFLDFDLGRDGGDLVLDIAGHEDARQVIEMFFAPDAA
jgi:hypothetical protein